MLHTLALVKVEYGGAKHFFKSFFQVALIHSHLSAQLLNGDGLTNMLDQYFPGAVDLLTVSLIGQEFTLNNIDLFFTNHTIQAVKQQHLDLCIDKDIFE